MFWLFCSRDLSCGLYSRHRAAVSFRRRRHRDAGVQVARDLLGHGRRRVRRASSARRPRSGRAISCRRVPSPRVSSARWRSRCSQRSLLSPLRRRRAGRAPAAQAGPARPLGEILRAAPSHRRDRLRPRRLWADELRHDRGADGDRRLRLRSAIAWLGIQWHVLGMFGPSFFTGRLIDRFGKERSPAAGLASRRSAAVAISGHRGRAFLDFADAARRRLELRLHRRDRAGDRLLPPGGTRDGAVGQRFPVFGTTALASFSSGQILNAGGWNVVNAVMFPALAVAAARSCLCASPQASPSVTPSLGAM